MVLNSNRVVRMLGHSDDSVLMRPNEEDRHVSYLVLEYYENGDLWDWVALRAFGDGMCRHIFK